MLKKNLILVIGLVIFAGSSLIAQDFEYIGAAKCKMCHNKAATGEQYKKWAEGPHANAMKSLSNEKSMEYAKANGIADPTTDAKCIKCHSTAGSIDASKNIGVKSDEGVSCESCHGPGSAYKSKAIMQDHAKSLANGLIVPDQKLCESCHNEKNPFHKPFNYAEYSKKIAHPNPAGK
ncbi:MAG: cytochrome c family protein [Bacteroidales bacterium]|nr:cytochrome c family protein [Bacteroidales bacterium]MCF8455115.1 cytochrome c family protein [Bacteroidales bacterium]